MPYATFLPLLPSFVHLPLLTCTFIILNIGYFWIHRLYPHSYIFSNSWCVFFFLLLYIFESCTYFQVYIYFLFSFSFSLSLFILLNLTYSTFNAPLKRTIITTINPAAIKQLSSGHICYELVLYLHDTCYLICVCLVGRPFQGPVDEPVRVQEGPSSTPLGDPVTSARSEATMLPPAHRWQTMADTRGRASTRWHCRLTDT